MGGEWFYDSNQFSFPQYLSKEEIDILREVDPSIKNTNAHRKTNDTINGLIGLQIIMPIIKNILKEKGIELIFARNSKHHPKFFK